jgi:iron complex outermembrane receptor protein
LQTEFTANPKLSITARATYRETGLGDKSYVYLSIDTNFAPGIDTAHIYRVPTYNYSNRTKGEISAVYAPFENHKIYGGIQYFQDNLETGNRGEILDTNKYNVNGIPVTNLYPVMLKRKFTIRNNFGSYLQYTVSTKLLHETSFTAGLRYDYNSDYKNPFSPRLAIVNQPIDKLTLKILYGTAFRAPTPTEVNAQITSYGSKAVDPEKVSTYELNVIYNPTSAFLIQVNGFDNELKNIYVLNSLIGGGFGTKQSLGRASIFGGEAHVDVFPAKMFSGFINLTYQKGRQTDLSTGNTFDIPNLPNYKGNIGIIYHGELFTLTLIGNWIGERSLPKSNPYGADKGYKMDEYFLTNAVLTTKRFFNDRVNASINVKNIFNVHYLEPGIRTADGILYSTVLEQPGINGVLKISVTLF